MAIGTEARKVLERNLKLNIRQMGMPAFAENAHIQSITGKTVSYSKDFDARVMARGNALLSLSRGDTEEEINAKIDVAIRKRNDDRRKSKKNI